ncbi:MAG: DUF5518 domain-containing protein [Methanoregula sp.]|nr:DUF5518 domain-containing protein [Methanoregula sp.]WML67772.1 MAG: hypothetical protein METHP_01331 [Methanoregula sp. SKADARSKE-2]
MDKNDIRFGTAIVGGVVVMLLLSLVTINILRLIPFISPVIGGVAAGLIIGKGHINGAKAGVVAGLIGAVVVGIDFELSTSLLSKAVPAFPPFTGVLFLVLALFYFPILSFIGGAIGGALRP